MLFFKKKATIAPKDPTIFDGLIDLSATIQDPFAQYQRLIALDQQIDVERKKASDIQSNLRWRRSDGNYSTSYRAYKGVQRLRKISLCILAAGIISSSILFTIAAPVAIIGWTNFLGVVGLSGYFAGLLSSPFANPKHVEDKYQAAGTLIRQFNGRKDLIDKKIVSLASTYGVSLMLAGQSEEMIAARPGLSRVFHDQAQKMAQEDVASGMPLRHEMTAMHRIKIKHGS